MALLDRFRSKPRTAPAPSLDVSMAFVMGQDGRLRSLSENGAVKSSTLSYSTYAAMLTEQGISSPEVYAAAWVSSVWANRCVNLIADNVNRIEWFVQEKDSKKKLLDHPLTIAIKRNKQKIIRKAVWADLIWGETFIVPMRNSFGYHSDLKWLNNIRINVDTSVPTNIRVLYMPTVGRARQFTPGKDISYTYTDNPFDDYRGLSLFESILNEIGIDNDVSRATRAFYANDTRIGLMLIPENDIPEVQAQTFMDYWKANFQGAKNAGKPVLMPRMIKDVKEIQRAPIQDDVAIRESVRREICAAFGVPLSVAGAWDDANYQSAPEQRRSFYEETVLPKAEMLAMDWNTHLLPFFDDTETVELGFSADRILALTENMKEKAELDNSRLVSGGLTVNEYRKGQKLPTLPNGDVLYVPNNVTVTPLKELGVPKPMPAPLIQPGLVNVGQPKPAMPSALPAQRPIPQLPANVQKQPVPSVAKAVIIGEITDTPENELAAWRKKAMNGGAVKAMKFICYALPKDIENAVRVCLSPDMDKAALKAVFDEAESTLKKSLKATGIPVQVSLEESTTATPEEYQTYWQEYDQLQAEIGDDWLTQYMARALGSIEDRLSPNLTDADIQNALMTFRDELVEEWVGDKHAPGVLTRMVLAGMAAGNQSLASVSADSDNAAIKAFLGIDWGLLAQEALNFAKTYIYDLITGIDSTTVKLTREAIVQWIASGEPLDTLKVNLTAIYKDPVRAAMIAQTEATRAYAEGANLRWLQAGVNLAVWKTVNDGDTVCNICQGLHNVIGDFVAGWKSRYNNKIYRFPSHPRCRCFPRPLLS